MTQPGATTKELGLLGRGALYNLVGRVFFVCGAMVVHVYAGRRLGPDLYGVFGVTLAVLMIAYIVLNNGVRQTVSKLVAAGQGAPWGVFRAGVRLQLMFGGSVALLTLVAAWPLARLLDDPRLLAPVALCAPVVVAQGLYFVFLGLLNGKRWFGRVGLLVSAYGLLRPIYVVGALALGLSVAGALRGLFLTSVSAVLIGLLLTLALRDPAAPRVPWRSLLGVTVPTVAVFTGLTLLLNWDLLMVKACAESLPEGAGGWYTSAGTFAKLSYWFLYALGTVCLPVATRWYRAGSLPALRSMLAVLMGGGLAMGLCGAGFLEFLGAPLLELSYGASYLPALPLLPLLFAGVCCIGMAAVFAHLGVATRDVRWMAWATGLVAALHLPWGYLLTLHHGGMGAATATSSSAALLCLLFLARLAWRFSGRTGSPTD